ncbi:hypothetical protein [Chryseosolibacter indicus]|uniref:Chromosome partitioning protein ParA n=1 Tax=Chryseosolibacter indicus TaxID=2782351 RepID=A0ABS5VZ98_9BACT|nr:hypothetical protein [Chryseosolibacter indicus]MBT1706175.1 hypothetical protein [Chryseosolibacter indicus]
MSNSKTETKLNVAAIVAVLLFVTMFVYVTIVMGFNDRLKSELMREKLKSELLLSEKLAEQKKNVQLTENVSDVSAENKITKNSLAQILKLLSAKEDELKREKLSDKNQIMQKQKSIIKSLEEKITNDSLNGALTISNMSSYSGLLESMLIQKNHENEQYLNTIKRLSSLRMEDVEIVSSKKNQRQTIRAARAKIVEVRLAVSTLAKNISFKIIDPSGAELPVNNKNSHIEILNDNPSSKSFIVSNEAELKSLEELQILHIKYFPSQKLAAGTYRIVLLNDLGIIGNLNLRLQ